MTSLRKPNPAYKDKNAFLDASAQDIELRGIAATASLQTNGLTPAEKYKQDRALRDAVDLHRAAEDMLEIKGSYFPR